MNTGEYHSPQCEVIEMQMTGVVSTSVGDVTVTDPWSGNMEEEC